MRIFRSLLAHRNIMATAQVFKSTVKTQEFDYFFVLDFEATCDNTRKVIPQEIIEFPVLKFNWKSLQVESEFHQYVQPRVHRELSPFCIELTGILQDMVDHQPHIEETLQNFHKWMTAEALKQNATFTFVTCGDWDLKTMLPSQCRYFGIDNQPYFKRWINIKKAFADLTGVFPKGMMAMLHQLHIPHIGRHHSGIDDCRNIAAILKAMVERGYVFSNTSILT
ncbi:ERI1 exoribonuclease 3-like [Babylonia areolata]|uniref:ERI1 exoribonuclease 3-like n=1 Tax=Babylonia areolata TaxID=304850 RepID=UPI003FD13F3E